MPKMKTHKGAAKRFKVTGNGKVMLLKPHGKMTRKSNRVHFETGKMHVTSDSNADMAKKLLGL